MTGPWSVPFVAITLLVAACGTSDSVDSVRDVGPSASAEPSSPAPPMTTDSACPKLDPVHLPRDLGHVDAAYVCGADHRPVAGDGTWLFSTVHQITGGLSDVLDAYADDDVASDPTVSCTTALGDRLVLYLHLDERVVAARAPTATCGHPTREAGTAYQAMTRTLVGEHKDRQVQSQLSLDSGCSDRYKDTLSLDEQYPRARPQSEAPEPLTAPISECDYRVETDAQGDRIGHLERHRSLDPRHIRELNQALANARSDTSCSRHEHTRFALLTDTAGSPTVVALDGCAVSQDDGRWWRAGDDLRAALK